MDSRLLELLDKYIEENRILKGEYKKKLIEIYIKNYLVILMIIMNH